MTDLRAKFENLINRRGALTLLLVVAFSALFFFNIGERNISSPDEGRYIEIPREMVLSGDYVLPRLNGILYFEKPPLFYWLEASAIRVLGISEWTMRLWPALLGIFGALMTYGVTRRFYGRAAGLVAGGVLATSLMYYALARFVILDMAESVLMSAALFAFLLSAEEKDEKKALWWARGGHAAAALAVLAKGLIGVLLPGLIGLVWIAAIGRWSFVRRALCPSGIAIFLVIALPWHILAAMRNHDFLWFYFVHEHFLRFTTTVHRRNEPMWYFIPVLLVGFLPWTGYLWHAIKDALPRWSRRGERPVELFLILWVAIVFVFFSFSDSKLPPYILPIFPPPGRRPRPCRGGCRRPPARVPHHGLRQVAVRAGAEGQAGPAPPEHDHHQGDQVPAQDRPARLRDQEGSRRAVPAPPRQGQDHDHVPRPGAVAPGRRCAPVSANSG